MASATPVSTTLRRRPAPAVRSEAIARAAAPAARSAYAAAAIEPLEDRRLMSVTLISVGQGGAPANGASGESSVSADGRFVVFSSDASNLVASDGNGARDVFVRDTQTNTTYLISGTAAGAPGNGRSFEPTISGDGNWVAFRSEATNLVTGDTNGVSDIFLTHLTDLIGNARTAATTTRVSIHPSGTQANGFSGEPSISFDGRYVAYSSFASNLVTGDGNNHNDVFRFDRTLALGDANKVVLVSRNSTNSGPSNGTSFDPSISADGSVVSFHSDGTDLVAGDANGAADVFLRNVAANTTTLISANPSGAAGNKASTSSSVNGSVSGSSVNSGEFVVFRSSATDLTTLDTNNSDDVFLRDTANGQTTLLSINQARTASGHGTSSDPSISADGHFAAFTSTANDLIASDTNSNGDIFVRDLQAGPIYLLSLNTANVPGNGASTDPYVSADGRFVSFTSTATDLAAGDSNAAADVFVATTPTGPGGTGGGGGGTGADTTPPTVALSADQIPPDTGDTVVDFNVDLADAVALNTVSLGDLTVTAPGGQTATAHEVAVVGSGTNAVATYEFTSPTGALVPAANGAYAITVPTNAIRDAANNSAAAGGIGSITLNVCPPNCPDLVPVITTALPGAVIGGSNKGRATVRVTNMGQLPATGMVRTTLYLSDDNKFSANDVAVSTVTVKKLKLKQNKSKTQKFKFTYPASLGTGSFFVIARADSGNNVAETKERNNFAPSSTAVAVSPPVIDLHGTVANPVGKLVRGGVATSTIVVTNGGNTLLSGKAVTINLGLTTDGTAASAVTVGTVAPKLTLKPGASKTIKVKFTFPTSLAAGAYNTTANIDAAGAVGESDETNNTPISASQFTLG